MKAASLITILFLAGSTVQAQFQKKFTLELSLSPLLPQSATLRDNRLPYLFSNFEYGAGGSATLVYNMNRRLSVGITGGISSFRSWQDPRTDIQEIDRSFFNVYSFMPNFKYRLLKRRISPFVTGGAGFSIYHAERAQTTVLIDAFYPVDFETEGISSYVSIDQVLIREPGYRVDPKGAAQVMTGFGIDFRISETVGFSVMACYQTAFTAGNTQLDQNVRYFSFPIGLNLSLGKSKTL